jgi:hypothetical protein
MILENGKPIYHGSYIVVDKPDLAKCQKGKDFGQGFYLTTDINQARRFVKSSIGKAIKNSTEVPDTSKGYLSVYRIDQYDDLLIYEFETANSEWLHCVAAHRMRGILPGELEKWVKYDIIAGKIANDTTNQVITAYINGVYGEVGSEIADETAIRLLKPEKLTDQICIRTKKAIEKLKYIGFEECAVK